MKSKRILSITIKRMVDTDPDTSWMGEYSNKRTSEFSIDREHAVGCAFQTYADVGKNDDKMETADRLCDCGENGDKLRGEYQYFNPSFNYVDKAGKPVSGNTPEEVRKYTLQDYNRMESLNSQQWCFLGILAEAKVGTSEQQGCVLCQTLTSGGLWGIESDSDKAYLQSVESEQLDELRDVLKSFGFSSRAISKAFQDVKHEDA